MSKLSTVTSLRNRLGKQDIVPVNNALDSALEAATLHLSELLRTGFDRGTHADVFWADSEDLPQPGQWFKFALQHGFVDEGEALTVTPSLNIDGFSTATALDASNVNLSPEKGIVRVVSFWRYPFMTSPFSVLEDRTYVKIEYTAGFEVNQEVYQNVPAWLVELAEQQAAALYACDDDGDQSNPERHYRVAQEKLWKLAEAHVRWYPSAFRPVDWP